MHRVLFGSALGLVALACAASSAMAMNVSLDESRIVRLRAPAGDVLVGNPSIADVTILTPDRIAVLGRGYGLTNLVITDRMGRTIFDEPISVSSESAGRVSVTRGVLVSNFTCTPRCERTALPGESKATAEPYASTYKDYADRASGGANTP